MLMHLTIQAMTGQGRSLVSSSHFQMAAGREAERQEKEKRLEIVLGLLLGRYLK